MQIDAGKTSIHSAYHMYRREELLERRGQSERENFLFFFFFSFFLSCVIRIHYQHKKTWLQHQEFEEGPSWELIACCWGAQNTDTALRQALSPLVSWSSALLVQGGFRTSLWVRVPTARSGTETDPESCPQPFWRQNPSGSPLGRVLPGENWPETQNITTGDHNRSGEKN